MFKVGDRVTRLRWSDEPIRRGVVIEVYRSTEGNGSRGVTLFVVKWDDTGFVERGYMEGGLEMEYLVIQ